MHNQHSAITHLSPLCTACMLLHVLHFFKWMYCSTDRLVERSVEREDVCRYLSWGPKHLFNKTHVMFTMNYKETSWFEIFSQDMVSLVLVLSAVFGWIGPGPWNCTCTGTVVQQQGTNSFVDNKDIARKSIVRSFRDNCECFMSEDEYWKCLTKNHKVEDEMMLLDNNWLNWVGMNGTSE